MIRFELEEKERRFLSPYASHSADSKGRLVLEPEDEILTSYMTDRDRIIGCKAFRRLKDKTQVFIAPEGDHFRTRLTHTLEVAQIARNVGRPLALNEDLIEAIALGHDLGHTPFGHAGESALNDAVKSSTLPGAPHRFDHAEQSLRVVDELEKLNLTFETRMGIRQHRKNGHDISASFASESNSLEASVVRICDRIAYLNHDLDDALRAGIIKDIPSQFLEFGSDHQTRVQYMTRNLVMSSYQSPTISMSDSMLKYMNGLKHYLFENVYGAYPTLFPDIGNAQKVIHTLFEHFNHTENLPEGFEGKQGAVDYLAGMTDRFAMNMYERIA